MFKLQWSNFCMNLKLGHQRNSRVFPQYTKLVILALKVCLVDSKKLGKSDIKWDLGNLGVLVQCSPDSANLTLLVRLRLWRFLYSHAILVFPMYRWKSPKSKNQLINKEKPSWNPLNSKPQVSTIRRAGMKPQRFTFWSHWRHVAVCCSVFYVVSH